MKCENLKFKTVAQLQSKIDAYFSDCAENSKPLTISGLALFLGFKSRQSIYDYAHKNKSQDLADCVKIAVMQIESYYEGALTTGKSPVGAIFWLKNHKWTDKQEIDHGGNLQINIVNYAAQKG